MGRLGEEFAEPEWEKRGVCYSPEVGSEELYLGIERLSAGVGASVVKEV